MSLWCLDEEIVTVLEFWYNGVKRLRMRGAESEGSVRGNNVKLP